MASTTTVKDVMQRHGLTEESKLYRQTLPRFLEPTAHPDRYRLSANEDPSEAVVDVYGQGHMTLAVHVGAGLAFAESADNQWQEDERVAVEVRLGDLVDQGSRLYPVESVTTERVWYLTLPERGVLVRRIG